MYQLALYTPPQAAHIVDVPPATLRNWARGYAYKTLGDVVEAFPMITTARPGSSRGPSVPFLGLAEAYVLAAFRAVGVPMQRIRPAIEWLDRNIGLPAALASKRLMTDGAEILFDFSRRSDPEDAEAARAIALRAHGWVLTTMDERYGADRSQRIEDEQWISEATTRGEVLLCKDRAIARGPVEARAVYMHDARVFTLARADLLGSEMVTLFLAAEQRLVRMAVRAKGPYVVSISPNGLQRLRLVYPPS